MATIKQELPSTSSHLEDPSVGIDPFEPSLTSTPLPPSTLYRGGRSHWDHFASVTKQMRQDTLLTDFTILAGDQKFPAHRAVLAAFSGLVRDRALSGDDSVVLDLRNLNPRVVPPLLDFIYEGETRVEKELVEELLAVAERMKIFGLESKAKVDTGDEEEDPLEQDVKGKKKKAVLKRKSTGSGSSTTTNPPPEKKKKTSPEDIERFPKKEEEYIKSDDGKQFVCNYCYVDFTSQQGIKRHVQLHTGEAKKLSCFRCDFEALQKSNLKTHCMKKHGINGKVFDTIMKKKADDDENNNNEDETVSGPSKMKQKSEAVPGSSRMKQEEPEAPTEGEAEEEAPRESQGLDIFKTEMMF